VNRDQCLEQAQQLINGDRKNDYGDAYLNHQRIADLWTTYLSQSADIELSPTDVAVMMMLLKIARVMNQHKDDSYVDICGYAALAAEMSQNVK
jgi:hypothetical protein